MRKGDKIKGEKCIKSKNKIGKAKSFVF